MIAQLLKIKRIRADRADQAVAQQEHRVVHASAQLEKARQRAEDYHQWRVEEEERRFAKAKQDCLLLRELEILRQEIALLREREAGLKERISEARQALEQEQKVLQEKKQLALLAHRAAEKFVQLHKEEQAAEEQLRQYREELEQEEFRTTAVIPR